jgi:acyl dehydratase
MAAIQFDELGDAAGIDLGHSEWMLIDQHHIDTFADATGDHQWIHVDPARAANGPFGGTIAHGYLTLSIVGARLGELLIVDGASRIVNYGLDRVRFPAPVAAGTRVRTHAVVLDVTQVTDGFQVSARVTAHAENGDKPVCVADLLVRALR